MHAAGVDYRPDIDGLRAIAVLSVVLCHAGLGLPGGFVGVDVFFVISGYLISGLILTELEQGTFSLAGFWERRVRRILPALFVVTIATVAAGWFLLMPDAYASLGKSVVALGLLASNMLFWQETGYFQAQAEEKPLLHTWSLGVEEQFYLLVPVFFLLSARRQSLSRAFFLLVPVGIVSFGLSIYGARYAASGFYLLPNRAWELLVGALLACLPTTRQIASPRGRDLAAAIGLSLIAIPCFLYDQETRFPGLAAVPPVLGAAFIIWAGDRAGTFPKTSRLLAWRPVVFVGLISYSLYLWHWPLLVFAQYRSAAPLSMTHRLIVATASFAVAVVSWRYVERPFRSRTLLASRRQIFAVGALTGIGILVAGVTLNVVSPLPGPQSALSRLFADTSCNDNRFSKNLQAKDVPANLTYLGRPGAPAELLVWGDSHAISILPAIEAACAATKISACAATRLGTPPTVEYAYRGNNGSLEADRAFNAAVMKHARTNRIRAVVLVGYWRKYARDDDSKLAKAILHTVDGLRAAGVAVYFMKDVPEFSFNVPRFLVRYSRNGVDLRSLGIKLSEYQAGNGFEETILTELKKRGVNILDPVPLLQAVGTSTTILPFDVGGSFYVDTNHLSAHGALAIKSLFDPVVGAVVSQHARIDRPALSVK